MTQIIIRGGGGGGQALLHRCIIVIQLTITFVLYLPVPLTPTGFSITRDYFTVMDNTVMFGWDSPGGSGPEAIVDNYTITVNPTSVSHPISNVVQSGPWNVTLSYNVIYTATITAVNCAGESNSFTLPGIEYGKHNYYVQSVRYYD